MKTHKLLRVLSLMAWLIVTGQVHAGDGQSDHPLQVYLPRSVNLEKSVLCLGDIAVIRGDATLAETARNITLGRIFVPNQKVVVNQNTVLSRLATHGIKGAQVVLKGAKQVAVQRSSQTIKGTDLVAMAQAFLRQHYACPSEFVATPLHTPNDIVIGQKDSKIQLLPRLIRGASHSPVQVQITVTDGTRELTRQSIQFRMQYQCQTAVATQDIARGTVLTKDNVKIEKQLLHKPQSPQWQAPWGQIAQRPIPQGSHIQAAMVTAPVAPITLKRNDVVVIRVERPGLVITAMGQAQANARNGDIVKVKNNDSQRVILCKVRDDGTVEPVF